jgi:hypothetical protein
MAEILRHSWHPKVTEQGIFVQWYGPDHTKADYLVGPFENMIDASTYAKASRQSTFRHSGQKYTPPNKTSNSGVRYTSAEKSFDQMWTEGVEKFIRSKEPA